MGLYTLRFFHELRENVHLTVRNRSELSTKMTLFRWFMKISGIVTAYLLHLTVVSNRGKEKKETAAITSYSHNNWICEYILITVGLKSPLEQSCFMIFGRSLFPFFN